MKLTFLGTSHGVPAADRYCTSMLVEIGETGYLIDAGAPVTDILLRTGRKLENIRALFTTHAHSDHTLGAIPLATLMTWYYRESNCSFYFTEERMRDAVKEVIRSSGVTANDPRIRYLVTEPDAPYEDENIKLDYFRTKHMPEPDKHPSYAILLTEKATGKKVLFTGDFSQELARNDVPEIISDESLDMMICEMAHFGTSKLAPYMEKCRAKKVFFNHVYPLKRYDDIKNDFVGKYPIEFGFPSDGDSVEI